MDTSEKVYNLNLLGNTSDIDIKAGVSKSGSLRGYFKELQDFTDTIQGTLDGLSQDKPQKELVSALSALHARLLAIGGTGMTPMIAEMILLINQNGDNDTILQNIQMINGYTLKLCQRIRETERIIQNVGGIQGEAAQTETADSSEESGEELAQRTKTIPRIVIFENLKDYIERFDFDAAVDELKSLSAFTFSNEIDSRLDKITKHLSNFDFDEATNEINVIMKIVSITETSVKNHLKKKILAIDDVPDVLNTLKSMLKNDYSVYCVNNHIDALKFVINNTPDIIFIDIEMPDMDGFTLLKIMRQMDSCKNVPAIFLTGNASAENIKASVESGGNDFVRKPIEYNVLKKKIKKHLLDI